MEVCDKEEDSKKKFQKSTYFVLFFVFIDRYCTSAIVTILTLYCNQKLGFDHDTSTAVYHLFVSLSYFLPILGSITADSFLGPFRTLVWMSSIFSFGCLIITLGSVDILNLPIVPMSLVGLLVITIGSGGIKPCITALGGDQYSSSETKNVDHYFVFQFFIFNCGSIISRTVTPIFRSDVKCFGDNHCYPLVFGLPAILMLTGALGLLIGRQYLIRNKPKDHGIVLEVISCITHAAKERLKSGKHKNNWLDYSIGIFDDELIKDVKILLKILMLMSPLPIFWALFSQQGSRWTFQATQMDGNIGNFFKIDADQFTFINPLFALILIPTFEKFLYPSLRRIGFDEPLKKVAFGGCLTGISFIIAAYLETRIKHNQTKLSILWLMPQYLILSAGEVMIMISLFQFTYSKSPTRIKSIIQAFKLLTNAIGNLIVVAIAGGKLVDSQFQEYLLFSTLMFTDMLVFSVISSKLVL